MIGHYTLIFFAELGSKSGVKEGKTLHVIFLEEPDPYDWQIVWQLSQTVSALHTDS